MGVCGVVGVCGWLTLLTETGLSLGLNSAKGKHMCAMTYSTCACILIAIVPKGILPQSYDNRAFWHDFQGILISYMEACLALKLHSLKLRSLDG